MANLLQMLWAPLPRVGDPPHSRLSASLTSTDDSAVDLEVLLDGQDGASRAIIASPTASSTRQRSVIGTVGLAFALTACAGGAAWRWRDVQNLVQESPVSLHPIALAADSIAEASTHCDEHSWPGSGARCGSCRVVVSSFKAAWAAERRLEKGFDEGTCHDYCEYVGRYCKAGWMTENEGSCAAVWEYEQSCHEKMPANMTICLCGNKKEDDAPSKSASKVSAPKSLKDMDCNPYADQMDFWTKSMLFTIPHITSKGMCNHKCNEIDECGAWTYGEASGVPGLSEVCFIKVVAKDGKIDLHPNDQVVSGVKSGKALCSDELSAAFYERVAKEGSLLAPTDVSGDGDKDSEGEDVEVQIDNREDDDKDEDENDDKETTDEKDDDGEEDHETVVVHRTTEKPKTITIESSSGGVIQNRHGICLAAVGDDSDIRMRTCDSTDLRQKWGYDSHTGQFMNSETGMCLSSKARTVEFSGLNLKPCDTKDWDQQWDYFQEDGTLKSWKGICIDGAEAVIDNGLVYMRACQKESPGQQWYFGKLSDAPLQKNPGEKLGTSLFCAALMLPNTYEQELLAMQYKRKVSLFKCDKYQVLSNGTYKIADGLYSGKIDSNLQCKKGGEFGTALNLPIFIAFWNKVVADGDYLEHDWVVKVDPDAVFFADRLRQMVGVHYERKNGVYLNNCKYGLHGPLEVFSKNAISTWGSGYKTCQDYFWKLCHGDCFWGEDLFIDQCLWKVLNVTRENDYRQLVEDHCDAPVKNWTDYTCEDTMHATYHPFKNEHTYMKCLDAALEAEKKEKNHVRTAAEILASID
eukprot:CAMPEP_0206459332 /NCGR_PEP_ID=MMETSP0324_2-20121206/24112_1 /ASSEMBLY_ACC=CAM_ASM_000836 /TAXON_ID=2866 /ORGANISM="Crypthecodinium cohnii, Strain Seligo" /LENGTH=804 /DNA_ID=CAMNT_0053930861 /DNA_START=33 /DNA_END=2447 /DNA_ORIENTATION=-